MFKLTCVGNKIIILMFQSIINVFFNYISRNLIHYIIIKNNTFTSAQYDNLIY